MPKTPEETRTLSHFEEEYKDPKKGKQVYYALRNKNKKFDRSQGGGFKDKKKGEWWAKRLAALPKSNQAQILKALK
jgi:hypothetical protein